MSSELRPSDADQATYAAAVKAAAATADQKRTNSATYRSAASAAAAAAAEKSSNQATYKNAASAAAAAAAQNAMMSPPKQPSASSAVGSAVGSGSLKRSSTIRDRCDYKWQRARGTIGALEVKSEPVFQVREELIPRRVQGREEVFAEALQAWEEFNLRKTFIHAVENAPEETCCCGLLADEDATKKAFVPQLNENWAKAANKRLLSRGFKVEAFLWSWQNTSGKSETNILLIRFIELSSYRLRRASRDDMLDFELVSLGSDELSESNNEGDAPQEQEMARS